MEIGVRKKTVKILKYNPEWKNEYLKEEAVLKNALQNYDIDIQHVGSTSIVGCKAKPIIDIAIGISNLEYGKKLIPTLQKIGYYYDGTADFGVRYFLKKCKNDIETHFIHIEDKNSRIWQNHVVFRDYMNINYKKVIEYSNLKEKLAQKFYNDRKNYTKAKETYIEETIENALKQFDLKPNGEDYIM